MEQIKKKNWYVFYTCPRAEKKVNEHLKSIGYETFLPLKKELRIWKNRQRKIIEVPLFSSYIFVNTLPYKIHEINKIHGVCTCVTCAKIPVQVLDKDMMSLKAMSAMDIMIVKNEDFVIGDKIRVIEGPLCGYEGVLIHTKGTNKFGINIECVNLTAVVDLNSSKIERI